MPRKSPFLISESDVLAKHYSLLDKEIETYNDFIVSTQWRVKDTVRSRFNLVVVKKWAKRYTHTKECFSNNQPCYAVEYKIDDEPTYGKGHQFRNEKNFSHIEKLNVYFVDRMGIHKLDLN